MSKMSELDIERKNIIKKSFHDVDIMIHEHISTLRERELCSNDSAGKKIVIESAINSLENIIRDIQIVYSIHNDTIIKF